jgi:RNA polymerase sigma-70 factor (ECF subfamily)
VSVSLVNLLKAAWLSLGSVHSVVRARNVSGKFAKIFRRPLDCPWPLFACRIPGTMQNSVETFTNNDLVSKIQQGDSVAEAALYEKFSQRIYFLALSELHSKDDAEDIRAETFLRVIQALREGKLRSADSLPSFIVGFALNIIREHIRHKYRTDSLEDYEYDVASEGSLENVFLDAETSRAIEEAVKKLKPREQEFLRLYYYEELPKEEISARLGIKEDRLRLIKSRTLQSFREIYKKMMPA